MEKDLNISSLIDVYGNFLSKKQKELCIYYFFDDLSLGEIAENEGITRQGVCDHIKRAQESLYKMENECGYLKKFKELKSLCREAKEGKESSIEKIFEIIESL